MVVSDQARRNDTGNRPDIGAERSAPASPAPSPSRPVSPPTAQGGPRRAWIGALPLLLGLVFVATVGLTAPSGAPLSRAWAAAESAVTQRLPDPQIAAVQAAI